MSSTLRSALGAALGCLGACACTARESSEASAGATAFVVAEQEPDGDAAHAGTLVVGETALGRIDARDADWWRVDLGEGEVVSLQVWANRFDQGAWAGNPPTLRVLDPDGVSLELVQDASASLAAGWSVVDPDVPAFRAPAAGSYYVELAADDGARTGGRYLLSILAMNDALALEHEPELAHGLNDTAEEAEALAPGVLHGHHVAGEQDWYRVTVAAPSLLSFALLAQRNGVWSDDRQDFDPALSLFDDAGHELAHNDDGIFRDSLLGLLCTGGDYLLRVGECCSSGSAPYFLVYQQEELAPGSVRTEVEPDDTPSSAPYVEFARPIEGTLTPGDVDYFAIPGRAGDRIEIAQLTRAELAPHDLRIVLENGRGDIVPADFGATLALGECLLAADDTYFVRVSCAANEARSYAFELRLVTASWEHEPNDARSEASVLDEQGRAAGRIDAPADVDLFVFEARAGMPVLLECFADDEFASGGFDQMDGLGSDMDPALEVLDARGRVVASATALARTALGRVRGRSTVSVAFLPAHDGTHYLAVRDARGGAGPTYGYALERH